MKRHNIVTKRTYKKGEEDKTLWVNCGNLVHFEASGTKPDSFILELNMFPDTKFYVFEQKPRGSAQASNSDDEI